MLVDFKRPTSHIKYLSSFTSDEWIKLALSNPIDILIDHAHCERKAAGVAIHLFIKWHMQYLKGILFWENYLPKKIKY